MRDIGLFARTLRSIRNDGDGVATRQSGTTHGFTWSAGGLGPDRRRVAAFLTGWKPGTPRCLARLRGRGHVLTTVAQSHAPSSTR